MKYLYVFSIIVVFLSFSEVQAQSNEYLQKIDSIHKHVLDSKVNDSISLAKVHYSLGELYRYSFSSDSAYHYYHKAEKVYKKIKNKYLTAITLYGIAVIQTYEKDYTGSEVTSVEAISLLDLLEETNDVIKYKSYIYNNLGIVFDELDEYEESIKYYKLAIKLKLSLKGDFKRSIDNSINNLARVYRSSGDYNLAKTYYQQILEDENLKQERPSFYALVLDNYAYTLYLSNDNKQLPGLYFEALKIADSVTPNGYNTIVMNQHLAEYYNNANNKDSAKFYAYKAKNISEQYHNDDLLKSLLLLSKVETDKVASKFLTEYITLSDSLYKSERLKRDKFARIRFETNKIEKEYNQIAKERMWLLIISIVVILASFLLYLVITQRNKNKELQFIQQQQETNEDIYNIMLSQNESIEEARELEKRRISQELHDGVLGRLFGTRLSLDSLNMSSTPEAIRTREQYIEELKTIEDDIRKVSHELSTDFLSGKGFIDIIKTLVETQTIAYRLKYDIYYDEIDWDSVPNKKKIHIYRIIQETLHNIYKHANATHVSISFKLKNSVICLTIIDDGSGFEVSKVKSGIGLKNMNSRIKDINGILNITSEKNVGTTVTIEASMT